MTIARYCGGLFLALSLAAMGAAVGCTQVVDDPESVDEEAVGEEELALSGDAEATGESSDGRDNGKGKGKDKGKDKDKDKDKDKNKKCKTWEATAEIDEDAKFAFIEVDRGCHIRRVEVDGEKVECKNGNGPKCNESGFNKPDCIINLNKANKLQSGKDKDEVELSVRVEGCEKSEKNIKIAVREQGNKCDRVDGDDIELECKKRHDLHGDLEAEALESEVTE